MAGPACVRTVRRRGTARALMQDEETRLALRRLEEALARQREYLGAASALDPQGQLALVLQRDLAMMEQERTRLRSLLAAP